MTDTTMVSISVRGGPEVRAIVQGIAAKRHTTMGDVVRDALESAYPDDFLYLSSFFGDAVASKQQSSVPETEG